MFNVKFRGDDPTPTQPEFFAMRRAALDALQRDLNQIAPGVDIPRRSQTLARVKGHANLARWSPIGLGGATLGVVGSNWAPGQEFVTALQGMTPAAGSPWGILLEPVRNNGYAWAIVSGLALASLPITDTTKPNKGADIVSGSLAIAEGGAARVLWRQSGTGTRFVILDLCPITPRWFVCTTLAAINAGASGDVQPVGNTALTLSAKNEASETIPSGAKIAVSWDDYQGLYVVSMEFC